MSKLLKFKFLLGVAVVAVMFVGVAVSNAAADCSTGSTTLRVGSSGDAVACLQSKIDGGLVADGSFGPKTQAAVKVWQAAKGLVADGVFGPKSRAVLEASAPVVSGPCTGGAVYNSVTGALCSAAPTTTLPAGCTSTAGFSPTTGQSCSAVVVVPASSGEGKLITFTENAPDVTDVKEGEVAKKVLNVSFEADLADQTITRVDVDFQAADSTQSDKPWKYMKEVSLVYDGTTVATVAGDVEASYSRTDETETYDTWTVRFSNLNLVVKDGVKSKLEVAVTALANVDGSDEGQSWEAAIPANGIRAVSPNGLTETYPATEIGTDFTFAASGTAALTFSTSAKDPLSGIVFVDDVDDTSNVLLFAYKGKATNGPVFIDDSLIEVDAIVTTGTGDQVSDFVQTFYLYADGVKVGTASAPTAVDITDVDVTFSNINLTIAKDKTVEFEVRADLQPLDGTIVVAGDKITMTLDASDVVTEYAEGAKKGDTITPTGDTTGTAQYMYVNAPKITLVSVANGPVNIAQVENTTDSVDVTMVFNVEAVGVDIYIDGTVTEDGDGTYAAGQGISYYITRADTGADAAALTTPAASLTSTATSAANTTWKVTAGTTKQFTFGVNVANTLTSDAANDALQFQTAIKSIGWDTSAIAATANNYIFSLDNYKNVPVTLGELDAV